MYISCSTPIEGEHILTIICVILATDHDSIHLKVSLKISHFPIRKLRDTSIWLVESSSDSHLSHLDVSMKLKNFLNVNPNAQFVRLISYYILSVP